MKKIVICAAGPSLSRTDFSAIRESGHTIMTVNNAWKMAPDAPHHYAGDLAWWENYHKECKSTGQRYSWAPEACTRFGLKLVKRMEGRGLCLRPFYVHHGGNSGFQAINLAYHLGFRSIVLVGFDMSRKEGAHFDGDHKPGMLNAPERHIPYWRQHMKYMARDLERHGVKVVNASEFTELDCFPVAPLAEAL